MYFTPNQFAFPEVCTTRICSLRFDKYETELISFYLNFKSLMAEHPLFKDLFHNHSWLVNCIVQK